MTQEINDDVHITGKVGIKTTNPSAELEVNGNIKGNSIESEDLLVQGKVGIGTTNPKEKLDVLGTIRLHGKNAFQGHDSYLRINPENEFSKGTYFKHRAIFDGGVAIGRKRRIGLVVAELDGNRPRDPENLDIVGIPTVPESLELDGNIRMYPMPSNGECSSCKISSIIVGTGGNSRALCFVIKESRFGPTLPSKEIHVSDDWQFNAVQKNFLIDHPLHPDTHELVHSTLEGPEVAVFYRGEAQLSNGEAIVKLPDYFEALTRKENRTVLLTSKFEEGTEVSMLAASDVKDGKFAVKMIDSKNPSQKFYWEVKAIRVDVDILEVERKKVPTNE